MFIITDDDNVEPTITHWEFTDCRGNPVLIDLDNTGDTAVFRFTLTDGVTTKNPTFEVFTNEELTRRYNALNNGKNPCGKWTGRNGKRICFENC